ncbi:MAG TPA: CHASE2 domain-containing protein [Rubrivivax sp.]|nr:CHASE2 domain-containing protein [Rubrivivax sp.]
MKPGAEPLPTAARRRAWSDRTHLVGAALLGLLALGVWRGGPWTERMQSAWFDAHQVLWPRHVATLPVTVVAIDQTSLVEIGQWPWPRDQLARLLHVIGRAEPAAIGINILMPEPDALSPERLLEQSHLDERLVEALRALPTHDAQLAKAMAAAPAVLAVAGTAEPGRHALHVAPVMVQDGASAAGLPRVPAYAGALSSIEELGSRARGWGLVSVESTRGVIRRMPTVANVQGTLVPALALEMLRVAQGAPALRVTASDGDMASVAVGRLQVPTAADGTVRVYFSPHLEQRFVSAVDVLGGRVPEADLRGQLVLIGLTGVALQEYQNTPLGERMPGSEIHAQLLENLLDGTLLRRPRWVSGAEALLLLALGGVLLWAVPRWRSYAAALLLLGCIAGLLLLSLAAFRWQQLLFDALTPGLGLLLFFGVLLLLTLVEATQQGRALERLVQQQREDGARLAGELQAAQRVQTAALPSPESLHGDPRVELYAALQPAREVGGDLYDFFMLDARRLFLLIGDVAGKGLSASIFMAVSKALYKSAMLRAPDAELGAIMAEAEREVSRDNPDNLFVTAFAAILDLHSGELHYCNAGHDNPYRLHAAHAEPQRIADGDGPPLCAVPGFDYRASSCRLLRGEMLCLITDGVTDAQAADGTRYGSARLQRLLAGLQCRGVGARALVEALQADVAAHVGGAEAADDLTILALRWNGPAGAAS